MEHAMNTQVRQAEKSGTVKAVSVADYIVERLAAEGIDHCFGVAGDYVFPICDAVDSSTKVKWIGCSNELNASYAADGYARVRGAAMLATTYGVGELSALNGVMGAKAEKSLVFHVVGMPSYQHQRVGKIAHHTLGDGVFGNFVNLSASAACCHAVGLRGISHRAGRCEADRTSFKRGSVAEGDGEDRRAYQECKICRRVSGIPNFAARLTKAGAKGDRSAGLSFRHNADGKMRH
jgi:Thiamine pyrophosphate enzyme, N-terminal TPP binding domain